MVLALLPHVERRQRPTALVAHERDGARQRAAAELHAGHGVAGRQPAPVAEQREQDLADQGMPLGGEHRLLAVEIKVAFFAGDERDLAAFDAEDAKKLKEAVEQNALDSWVEQGGGRRRGHRGTSVEWIIDIIHSTCPSARRQRFCADGGGAPAALPRRRPLPAPTRGRSWR